MSTSDHLAAVDRLLTEPFPAEEIRGGGYEGGPGWHTLVLHASRDFWDDPGPDVVEAAAEEVDEIANRLEEAMAARWGEPIILDLCGDPGDWDGPDAAMAAMPAVFEHLSGFAAEIFCWRLPGYDRFAAMATGQHDREFPIVLVVVAGHLADLDRVI